MDGQQVNAWYEMVGRGGICPCGRHCCAGPITERKEDNREFAGREVTSSLQRGEPQRLRAGFGPLSRPCDSATRRTTGDL